jgi:hypothetical protein
MTHTVKMRIPFEVVLKLICVTVALPLLLLYVLLPLSLQIEVCDIAPGQRVDELTDEQTAELIRVACR